MKNRFLSRFDPDNLRKTIIYFGIALPIIIISLVFGIEKNDWAAVLILFGFAFFFYALLRPWANAKYYGIMCIILIIIITLFLGVVMKKLNSNLGKEISESVVMIFIVGVMAGIVGIFRFRKSD